VIPPTQRYFVFEVATSYDSTRLILSEQGGSQWEAVGAVSALMSITPAPAVGSIYATAGDSDPLRFWRISDDGATELKWKPRQTLRRRVGHPPPPRQQSAPPRQADELADRRSPR
jgi:hypothetical protein